MVNSAVFAGLAAGALWGFVFVVPKILVGFDSSFVALGRFIFFGVFSLAIILVQWKKFKASISRDAVKKAFLFALLGNSLYYYFLVLGIRYAGITASSLLVGLLPVTVAIAGNRGRITTRMLPSLTLIMWGVLLVNVHLFFENRVVMTQNVSVDSFAAAWGILFLIGALALWTWYAVANSKFLKANPKISGNLWSSLTGAFTLIFSPLIALSQVFSNSAANPFSVPHTSADWVAFFAWSAVLGCGSSWLALWLWNTASKKLSTTLSGQLIVSETVFALLYGFILEHRFPTYLETAAMISMILGVIWAIRSDTQKTI